MKREFYLYILLISLLAISCHNNNEFENTFAEYYNENYFPNPDTSINQFNCMMETLERFENDLLEEGLLDDVSIESYKNLTHDLLNDSSVYIELNNEYLDKDYLQTSFIIDSYFMTIDFSKQNKWKIDEGYFVFYDALKIYLNTLTKETYDNWLNAITEDIFNRISCKTVLVSQIYWWNYLNLCNNNEFVSYIE